MPSKILVITGPTATGKTHLAILLAQRFGGEIVSADSMQVYRGLDIGTAKPTAAERAQAVHHMVDVVSPFSAFSAGAYGEMAGAVVEDILGRGVLPIVVGGTGLYIDALIRGTTFAPLPEDPALRRELERLYDKLGGPAFAQRLAAVDPAAARLHPNDKKRLVRAMEVYQLTGETISAHDALERARPPRYDALKIALNFADRADLYARIDRRVDQMMAAGLEQEVRYLLERGLGPQHTAMQAIGYKELAAAITAGTPIEEAVDQIKQESRRYAKRQLTWLRRDSAIRWIVWKKTPDFGVGVQASTQYLEEYGILSA